MSLASPELRIKSAEWKTIVESNVNAEAKAAILITNLESFFVDSAGIAKGRFDTYKNELQGKIQIQLEERDTGNGGSVGTKLLEPLNAADTVRALVKLISTFFMDKEIRVKVTALEHSVAAGAAGSASTRAAAPTAMAFGSGAIGRAADDAVPLVGASDNCCQCSVQ